MHFTWFQMFALDSVFVVKVQNMLSLHGCFLLLQRNNLIKVAYYDETKKRAHDSQIVRAKEYLKLSHYGPSQRPASDTNGAIIILRQSRH